MKKIVLVGAGYRGFSMFAKPLIDDFRDVVEFAGVYDINRKRAEFMSNYKGASIPVYDSFDTMMKETHPDAVIVTTIDRYHHEYIIKALEYGADAISEKPMTIDDEKCNAILEAEKRTGKKVIVTFNLRFTPFTTRIKELLLEGAVGKILSISYDELLDTSHGADYFRRWHRRKENSGGLLLHKSTHHFDLINWWLMEEPDEVYANGTTRFYGPTRENRGERCRSCKHTNTCEFAFDYTEDPLLEELYFKVEEEDGYLRDRCVFADEIDIEDTMSVTVKYKQGAVLTYSLIAYSPYEAWRVEISGTNGRLEASCDYGGEKGERLRLFKNNGEVVTYKMKKPEGTHGGGDIRLRRMLFKGDLADKLGQCADSLDGVKSIMIGICANKSIREGKRVKVSKLLKGDFINP